VVVRPDGKRENNEPNFPVVHDQPPWAIYFYFCVAFDWAMMLLHYLLMLGGILWYDYSEYGV